MIVKVHLNTCISMICLSDFRICKLLSDDKLWISTVKVFTFHMYVPYSTYIYYIYSYYIVHVHIKLCIKIIGYQLFMYCKETQYVLIQYWKIKKKSYKKTIVYSNSTHICKLKLGATGEWSWGTPWATPNGWGCT